MCRSLLLWVMTTQSALLLKAAATKSLADQCLISGDTNQDELLISFFRKQIWTTWVISFPLIAGMGVAQFQRRHWNNLLH